MYTKGQNDILIQFILHPVTTNSHEEAIIRA